MNLVNPFAAFGSLLFGVVLCLAGSLQAQETNVTKPEELAVPKVSTDADSTPSTISTSDTTEREGRIVSYDQVELEVRNEIGPVTPDSEEANLLDRLRLSRTDYPTLSQEVVRRLRDFRRQRERYLQEQERLIKEFKGATDAEREKIRETLRERRLQWLERSRNLPDETRDRLRDMVRKLPQYREAFEAAQEDLKNQVQDSIRRRGND